MLRLSIYKSCPTRIPAARLMALFGMIVKGEMRKGWQGNVHLVFTDDQTIRKLNKRHRGKDKATDVLSFPLDSPTAVDAVFGEVYISTATATRQAKELGASISEEYLRLACHGWLHLFGYDHLRRSEAKVMQARERRYLGLGA